MAVLDIHYTDPRIYSNNQVSDCMISTSYVIWLTLLIDNSAVMSLPITSERFDSYITCTYYAIDAKNQMGIVMKEAGSAYTVTWACRPVAIAEER